MRIYYWIFGLNLELNQAIPKWPQNPTPRIYHFLSGNAVFGVFGLVVFVPGARRLNNFLPRSPPRRSFWSRSLLQRALQEPGGSLAVWPVVLILLHLECFPLTSNAFISQISGQELGLRVVRARPATRVVVQFSRFRGSRALPAFVAHSHPCEQKLAHFFRGFFLLRFLRTARLQCAPRLEQRGCSTLKFVEEIFVKSIFQAFLSQSTWKKGGRF